MLYLKLLSILKINLVIFIFNCNLLFWNIIQLGLLIWFWRWLNWILGLVIIICSRGVQLLILIDILNQIFVWWCIFGLIFSKWDCSFLISKHRIASLRLLCIYCFWLCGIITIILKLLILFILKGFKWLISFTRL